MDSVAFTVSLLVFIHYIFVKLLNKDYVCTNGEDYISVRWYKVMISSSTIKDHKILK